MRAVTLLLLISIPAFAGDIFAPDATLKVESAKGEGGEGPAWHPELGVLTSGNDNICRLSLDGKATVYREGAGTNGLLWDAEGRLLACEPKFRRVTRTDIKTGKITVLADTFNGKRFNQPNDITVDSKGRVYFTDPCYGGRGHLEITDTAGKFVEGVYRIDEDGKVTQIIGRELERPNGILVSADDKTLYVADNNNDLTGARKLYRFALNADGSVDVKSKKALYDWKDGRGPDGLKQDSLGRLFVAGGLNKPNPPAEPSATVKGGIYVLGPDGKLLDFLPVPTDEVTNCAFGGADLKTLYVTGGGTLYSIRVNTPGRVAFPRKKS